MVPSCAKERYESFHQSVIISSSFFKYHLTGYFSFIQYHFPDKFLTSLCNIKTAVDKEIS